VIALAALDNWMSRIGDIAAPGWAGVVMSLQAGEGRS
jgi:hypothetical protein